MSSHPKIDLSTLDVHVSDRRLGLSKFTHLTDIDAIGWHLLRLFQPHPHAQWYGPEGVHEYIQSLDEQLILPDFIGFIEDYWHAASFFARRRDSIIVDVGCASGLQHLFFSSFKGYIGIDHDTSKCKAFLPNASFVSGEFGELVKSGRFVITDDMIGLANMSILYPERYGAMQAFNQFKRKVIQ